MTKDYPNNPTYRRCTHRKMGKTSTKQAITQDPEETLLGDCGLRIFNGTTGGCEEYE